MEVILDKPRTTVVELRSSVPVAESPEVAAEVTWQVCSEGRRHHLKICRLALETHKVLVTMAMPEGVEGLTPQRHGEAVSGVLIAAVRIGIERGQRKQADAEIQVTSIGMGT